MREDFDITWLTFFCVAVSLKHMVWSPVLLIEQRRVSLALAAFFFRGSDVASSHLVKSQEELKHIEVLWRRVSVSLFLA